MYVEKYKTLNELKDNINRWRDITCSWVGRIDIMKIITLSNVTYRFNPILIKLSMAFSHRSRKKHFTIHMETQKNPNSQTILRKQNGARGITFPTSDDATELQPSEYDTDTETEI